MNADAPLREILKCGSLWKIHDAAIAALESELKTGKGFSPLWCNS
ncbi:MAG: hypothetical protein NWQ28_07715 [Nodularia sp. (in: cyanobacteria)]|nr:hypothetical protein [Nodularia sp. (in: cyanobacteria)]